MTPERLTLLTALQRQVAADVEPLTVEQAAELRSLQLELAAAPEVADDPSTPFVNETRMPNLDGTDYGAEQLRRDVRETVADVKVAVGFFAQVLAALAKIFGR